MVHPSWNDYPILFKELDSSKNKGLTLYGKKIEVTELPVGTKKKLDWRCSTCAHEWRTTGGSRIRGRGCPACVNQAVHIDGRNSMAQTHPKLAKEFQGDATKVIAGTTKRLDWKCSVCDNEWKALASSRVSNNSGCPFCKNGQLHSDGRNSMANTHPQLSKEFQGDPTQLTAATHKKLDWKCLICQNEWTTSGKNRVEKESGCPFCIANHLHSDGRNSMAVTHPELAKELLGDSTAIIASVNSKLRWECQTCTHIWEATGNHRVFSQSGCPACTNQEVHMDGRNSLAVMFPEIALECKQDAKNILSGSQMKCDWECQKCSHVWQAQPRSRTQRGDGCPACANQVVHMEGLNSMYYTHPELAEEYQGDSMKVLAGTAQKLSWLCKECSFSWKATGASRTKGTGCPSCSKGGYDPSKPGIIYIMEYNDSTQRWLKVGISNDQEKRLKDLRRSASEYSIDVRFLEIFKFEDGKQPPSIEKNLLSQREIRFDAEYDIDGRSEFFKYDSLKTIRRHIENHL